MPDNVTPSSTPKPAPRDAGKPKAASPKAVAAKKPAAKAAATKKAAAAKTAAAKAEPKPKATPKEKAEPKQEAAPEKKAASKKTAAPKTKAAAKAAPKTKAQSVADAEAKPAVAAKKPAAKKKAVPKAAAKPKPKTEPKPKIGPEQKVEPEPKPEPKPKPKPKPVDESVVQRIREEKAATEHADESAIDQALSNLRKADTSSLPDPTVAPTLATPTADADADATPDAGPPLTGFFGVLDRAQNAMATAEERLVAEANEPPQSHRTLQAGLIIGGLVVLLIAGAFVWYQMRGQVAVPDLIGMSQTNAVAALNAQHLKVGQLVTQASATADPGTVIDQSPNVDTKVARGAAVALTVAQASDQVMVPSVTDQTPTAATATLTQARLIYQEVMTFSDTVPPGQGVGQIPVAGTTVASGSTVTVLVSQGSMRTPITVPKVLGLSKADAAKLLSDQGFTPLFYYAQTTFGTINEAVTQTPSSTGLALPGSVVMVLMSQGNSTKGMIVPDTTGKTEAAAKTALQNAGFNVDVRKIATSSAPAGQVVSQTPQASDTRLGAGATVGLLVSVGSDPTVKMPSLLGASLSASQNQLRSRGLEVVVVPLPPGQQNGIVTQQFPAGGLSYQLGLPVLLYAPPRED